MLSVFQKQSKSPNHIEFSSGALSINSKDILFLVSLNCSSLSPTLWSLTPTHHPWLQTCWETGKQLPEKACRPLRAALLCLGLPFSIFWAWPHMGNEGSIFGGHLGVSGARPVPIAQSLHTPGAKALKIYFPADLATLWEDPNVEQCFSFTAESPAWLNTRVPHGCPKPMCLNVTQGEVRPALLENCGCFFQVDSFPLISGGLDHLWGDRLWGNKNYVQQAAYWE